VVRFNKRALTD